MMYLPLISDSTSVDVLVLISIILVSRLLWNKYGHGINKIPGPALAPYSDLWRFYVVSKRRAQAVHQELHRKYGKIVRIGPNAVSVSNPIVVKVIYGFNSGFVKSDFYTLFRAVSKGRVLQSLVNITDEKFHAKIRRHVANAFAMSTMLQFELLVDSTLTVFLQQLSERYANREDESGVLDFGQWLQFFTFDVIRELTFSKRLGFVDKGIDIDNIMKNIDKVGFYVSVCGQMPFLDSLLSKNPIRLWLSKIGWIKESSPVVDFARERMTNHEERKSIETLNTESKTGHAPFRRDFLSRFREAQLKDPIFMSDERVLALTVGNVLGGSDTTAITLRAVFYYLLRNPDKLDKLVKEIDEADQTGYFRSQDGLPKWEEVREMPYLDSVIKETVRIYPATGLILERVVPPQGVSVCGHYLSGGTIVGCNAWTVHQDKDVYGHDSEVFRPERWLEASEEKKIEMNNSNLTFGAGPRSCLGKNISYLEIYKLVPAVLRRFEVSFAHPDQDWHMENAWLVKQTGFYVKLKDRKSKIRQAAA